MSRSAAFQFITRLDQAGQLLHALAAQVVEPLPLGADALAQLGNREHALSLRLPACAELQALDTGECAEPGWLTIGAVWTQFQPGQQWLLVTASAATSDMAAAFEESPLRECFIALAQRGGCLALLLVDDWNQNHLLWRAAQPAPPASPHEDALDRLCRELLAAD